jgi:hypothetical protein
MGFPSLPCGFGSLDNNPAALSRQDVAMVADFTSLEHYEEND